MSSENKQIYIPDLNIKGTFIEEVGAEGNRVVYPGTYFDVKLGKEDFENQEDYHSVWIAITKAVKAKLDNAKHLSS